MTPAPPRLALVCFGEVNSPRELIERKCAAAREAVAELGLDVVAIDPVSDDPGGATEQRARQELGSIQFDLLVICIAGWIPSQTVINVIDPFRAVPMVLWGLTGEYRDGRLVTTADQAGTTALRDPMNQLGYRFTYAYDTPDRPYGSAARIAHLARTAQTSRRLRSARIGMMGYRDMNLYATLMDHVALRRVIGPEVESFDTLEIVQGMESVQESEVAATIADLRATWQFDQIVADSTMNKGVRMYLALREKARERAYEAVSLVDVYGVKKLLRFPPGMAMMLLTDREGIATIPENDVGGAVTQLVIRYLTGQVGAYFEFYEFFDDRLLLGVPDYIPSEIVEGKVRVVPWPGFGGLSEGILNVSEPKTGLVTLCRLGVADGRFKMHTVIGGAHRSRPWEEAGWDHPAPQLPSLEVELHSPVDQFAQQVLGQHYILAYGDHRHLIGDFCRLLGIDQV